MAPSEHAYFCIVRGKKRCKEESSNTQTETFIKIPIKYIIVLSVFIKHIK